MASASFLLEKIKLIGVHTKGVVLVRLIFELSVCLTIAPMIISRKTVAVVTVEPEAKLLLFKAACRD